MTGRRMSRTESLFPFRWIPKVHGPCGIAREKADWMEEQKETEEPSVMDEPGCPECCDRLSAGAWGM
jgi:hypothetical protein